MIVPLIDRKWKNRKRVKMKCPNCENENCEMVEWNNITDDDIDSKGIRIECMDCGFVSPAAFYEENQTDEQTTNIAIKIFNATAIVHPRELRRLKDIEKHARRFVESDGRQDPPKLYENLKASLRKLPTP